MQAETESTRRVGCVEQRCPVAALHECWWFDRELVAAEPYGAARHARCFDEDRFEFGAKERHVERAGPFVGAGHDGTGEGLHRACVFVAGGVGFEPAGYQTVDLLWSNKFGMRPADRDAPVRQHDRTVASGNWR